MPLLLWQISLSDDVAMLQEIWSFDLSDYQTINLNLTDVKMNFSYLGNSRQHFLLWVCSWDNRMNLFPHEEHWWGFSPVWTLSWSFRCPDWEKLFSQCEHLYGFSPVWILWWDFKWVDVVKVFPQCEQI